MNIDVKTTENIITNETNTRILEYSDKIRNDLDVYDNFTDGNLNKAKVLRKHSHKTKDLLKMLNPEELKIGGLSDDNAADHLEDDIDSELNDEDEHNFILDSAAFQSFMARYEALKDEMSSSKEEHKIKNKKSQAYNTFMLGDNRDGICGTEANGPFAIEPTIIYRRFKQIICGYHHNAAIDESDKVYTWGRSIFSQLGQAEVINRAVPTLISKPLKNICISSICCGWQHTMAVITSGFLFTWGLNFNGQHGLGDYLDRDIPTLGKMDPLYALLTH